MFLSFRAETLLQPMNPERSGHGARAARVFKQDKMRNRYLMCPLLYANACQVPLSSTNFCISESGTGRAVRSHFRVSHALWSEQYVTLFARSMQGTGDPFGSATFRSRSLFRSRTAYSKCQPIRNTTWTHLKRTRILPIKYD